MYDQVLNMMFGYADELKAKKASPAKVEAVRECISRAHKIYTANYNSALVRKGRKVKPKDDMEALALLVDDILVFDSDQGARWYEFNLTKLREDRDHNEYQGSTKRRDTPKEVLEEVVKRSNDVYAQMKIAEMNCFVRYFSDKYGEAEGKKMARIASDEFQRVKNGAGYTSSRRSV